MVTITTKERERTRQDKEQKQTHNQAMMNEWNHTSDDSGLENNCDMTKNKSSLQRKRLNKMANEKRITKLKFEVASESDSASDSINEIQSTTDRSDEQSSDEQSQLKQKPKQKPGTDKKPSFEQGKSSTSSSSESNLTEHASETSSISIHPDDAAFDDICTDLLAKHVMKNKAGIRAVTDIARFKLKESLAGVKVKVGFVGEPSSGKTSLIEAIFGKEVSKKSKEKDSVKYETYKFPGWKNIKFAEIPAVTSHRRLEREEYLEEMKIKGYDLIVIVTENHIREWAMWMARELKDLDIPYIFVRTKIDKTTSEDAKKFPRTFCEQRLVKSIRDRCEESIKNAKLPMNKTYVISTNYPDKWDYRALVQALGEDLSRSKKRSLNLSLPPLTPHLINEKQKAHAQHIWMIAALSVASGLMEIPGFAISADIELLRQEIDNYRKSLGITDSIIANLCDDEENPALEAAWELIFYDSGIHSILRQTAMELDPEDLMNFAKKVPLLGGGISFPATCSALKFVLQELSEMALRYVSKDLTECESLDDINSSRDADSLLSLSDYDSQ